MIGGREIPPTAGLPLRWSDWIGSRARLEDVLAEQLGTPRLQYECSGTVCLLIALLALRQRSPKRQRVIVPAYTCPLVVLAIRQAGLQAIPCDLRRDHFDLDEEHLGKLCDEQTLAVIPTHLGGRLADVEAALAHARRHGAYVIEDAAQALGARQLDASVGLAGDVGFFSLAAGKGLTTYEGGLLVARDAQLREELAWTSTRTLARRSSWELRRLLEFIGYGLCYRPSLLGLVYGWPRRRALANGDPIAAVGDRFAREFPRHRAGRWRAAVAARASERLSSFQSSNATQAHRRIGQLRRIEGVQVFGDEGRTDTGVWPMLMVLLPNQALRDRVLQRLWNSPLGVSRMFIHALPDYPELHDLVGNCDVPNARDLASRMLTISNSPWLRDEDFERVEGEIQAGLQPAL